VIVGLKKGRLKLRSFRLELVGEVDRDVAALRLGDELGRWQPQVVTVEEGEDARRAAEEGRLFVARMAKGRATRFRAQVGLEVPEGREPLQPAQAVATLLHALLLNPKTNLLGTWALEQEVNRRLAAGEPFGYLYMDIDRFKSYNDSYGVAEGDKVIQLLAEEVERAANERGNDEDVCSHIGGDDFAIVTTPDKMEEVARPLIADFAAKVVGSYPDEDVRKRGGIETTSRKGEKEFAPLMKLTVAGVDTSRTAVCGYVQLCEMAAELKKHLKEQGGNRYGRERRRGKAPAAKRPAS
jgi:GGDEF domain-containing protein